MNVMLINAPYLDVYGPDKKLVDSNFPLGIGYIAAFLMKNGHNVSLIDPEAEELTDSELRKKIRETEPDIAGISCVTYSFHNAKKYAQLVKEEVGIPVILGGHHASALPEVILRQYPDFDFVVVGEGEISMVELCHAIEKGRNFSDINGLCFRDGNEIARTPSRERMKDFSNLPYPARELINLENYKPNNQTSIGKKSASIITSRGCPYHCVFCSAHNVMGYTFRPYHPEYVAGEIEYLVNHYKMEHIAIKDDTFTMSKKRTKAICELILKENIKVYWSCNAAVNTVDYELLELMKRAGCCAILYGIESGNPVVLKNMKKGITMEQCREALKATNALGIKSLASFVFGLPGETKETIDDTIRFAIELEPTIAMFYVLVPLPGSEMFERTIKTDPGNIINWLNFAYTATDYVIEVPGCSNDDLRKFVSDAYIRFYSRPKQIYKMLRHLNSFDEFKTYAKGGIGLLRRLFTLREQSS